MEYLEYGSRKDRVWLHPASSQWLVMNPTARAISLRLLTRAEPAKVAGDITADYGVPLDVALRDVFSVKRKLDASRFLPCEDVACSNRIPSPHSIFIFITQRCNLSCPHCCAGGRSDQTPLDLPTGVVHSVIDELKSLGGRGVIFGGGEPLLHPDIRSIVEHARPELTVRLLTNGTLMDQDMAAFLAQNQVQVQVSIDGSTASVHDNIRGRGAFEKALQALHLLQQEGLGSQLNIATTVMRQNMNDLQGIIELAKRLRIPMARFLPLRKRGRAVTTWKEIGEGLRKQDVERFYDLVIPTQRGKTELTVNCGLSGFNLVLPENAVDDIWCDIGRQLVVNVDGTAYPCSLMMMPDFCLGSVFTESLKQLFSSESMNEICEALTSRRLKIEGCAQCLWRNLCQGGCMGMALEHKGTIWDTDDFCEYRKKLYREAFDRILAIEDEDAG